MHKNRINYDLKELKKQRKMIKYCENIDSKEDKNN